MRYILGTLLAFGALNAFAGGYYALSGAEGVPVDWLVGSPFTDYFIPGLILLVVVGGAFTSAALMIFAEHHLGRVAAMVAAGILLVWIAAQVAIIGYVSWMQPVTLAGGILALALGWFLPPLAAGPDRQPEP